MKSLDEAVAKFKLLKQKLKQISEQPVNQTPKFSRQNKQNQANMQNTINQFTRLSKTKPVVNKKQSIAENTNIVSKSSNKSYRKQRTQNQQKQKQKQMSDDEKLSKVLKNKKTINRYENQNEAFFININNSKEKQLVKDKGSNKNGYFFVQDEKTDSKIQTQKKSQHRKNNSWNCEINSSNVDNSYEVRALTSLNSSRVDEFGKELKQKQRTLEEINQLLQRKKKVLESLEKKLGAGFLQDTRLDTTLTKGKRGIRAPNLFQMQAQARKRSKSKTMTIRWK